MLPSLRINKSPNYTPIPIATHQQQPVATTNKSPSPSLPMPKSTTPASSTYSNSSSSQHDPSSPPHLSALPPSDPTNNNIIIANTNTMYHSNSAPTSANRASIDVLDVPSINGAHATQYRTSTAFNPAYSTNPNPFTAPSHTGFNALGPSPNPQQQQQQQQQQRPYRTDLPPSASFPSHFAGPQPNYPTTKADVFGTSQSLDALSRYDYESFGDSPVNSAPLHAHTQPHLGAKQAFNGFGAPGSGSGSALLQSQQVQVSKMPQQGQTPQQTFVNNGPMNGAPPFVNGHGPPPPQHVMQNGIAFAAPPPHVHGAPGHHAPAPGPGPGQAQGMQQGPPQQQAQHQQQSARGDQSQEEISTIFVVGFPEDMHEREFQNMFTFSVGFEAATLKIPNKDSSAYGPASGASGATSTLRQAGFLPPPSSVYPTNPHHQVGLAPYAGAQDPYNLVTVNSGGVVVDGPQGTSSSWQQSNPSSDQFSGGDLASSHSQHPAMPPRKQIIGFAKFRSRQEALDARDVLQGRRVDIEKGAVLKAEMAKKNLHTKRGVGPLGLPLGLMGVGGGVVGPEMLAGVPGLNGFAGPGAGASASVQMQGVDALTQRDRELGVLGAMGLGGLTRRVPGPQDDDKERRDMAQRPRDEEERRRKEKELEKERNNKLRMSNATVYDAFHSVPMGPRSATTASMSSSSQSTLTPGPGYGDPGSAFPGYGFQSNGSGTGFQSGSNVNDGSSFGQPQYQSHPFISQDAFGQSSTGNTNAGAWGLPSKPTDTAMQKTPALPSSLPPRPPSSLQSSPPANIDNAYLSSASSGGRGFYGSDSSAFSPSDFPVALPPIGPRPRAHSPIFEGQPYSLPNAHHGGGSSHPQSSSSSVAGSQSSLEGDFSRTLTVSTHQGMTSPQLPSPGSGGSSNNARQGNASDQNPPINTLYVGNLPNSPVPTGYPPNYLEESLRVLFSRCPGYRKLCFRQKSNGPMCFVEFEDVSYATKALNDLYGNQLNGFVKGGIRLSFSKNPLGVRPTPSTTNSHQSRRDGAREWNGQQQQHPGVNYSIHDAFQARAQPQQQGLSLDIGSGRPGRHEPSEMGSPNPMYNYSVSPPPSRFFSPPPSSAQSSFGAIGPASAYPRSSGQGGYTQTTANAFGGSQHSPPFYAEGDERLRFRDAPPPAFTPSPGLETTARVG